MSKTWKSAIIEGSMVLVGVLLALLVDSWREDLEFQERVDITEAQIVKEIQGNRDRLIDYRDDFVERQERLEVWGANLDTSQGILRQLQGFPGIPGTFMNRSAWSMANNSQITEHINYDFYDAAFKLYALDETTEDQLDVALDVLLNVQGFDENYTEPLLEVLKLYFMVIINNLDSSMQEHNKFLENFGNEA